MTICTIDVHARDVVAKLIQQKVENAQAFTWLCRLRHRWVGSSHPRVGQGMRRGRGGEELAYIVANVSTCLELCCHANPSIAAGGKRRRRTALPTSVMLSSSTRTSTWGTQPGWLSPLSQAGMSCISSCPFADSC